MVQVTLLLSLCWLTGFILPILPSMGKRMKGQDQDSYGCCCLGLIPCQCPVAGCRGRFSPADAHTRHPFPLSTSAILPALGPGGYGSRVPTTRSLVLLPGWWGVLLLAGASLSRWGVAGRGGASSFLPSMPLARQCCACPVGILSVTHPRHTFAGVSRETSATAMRAA